MATYTEGYHAGEFLGYHEPVLSFDEETIVSGAGVVKAGTVLGKITTGGKFTPYDDGLSNGAQTAVAILLHEVDATSADVQATVVARLATVDKDALQWHTDVDATAKTAAYTALLSKMIKAY
jgi:hypothetical protein